jgi:hypothetical protein
MNQISKHIWLAIILWACLVSANSKTYNPDTTDFANPERGWFHQGGLSENYLKQRRNNDNITVVRRYFRLDSYRNSDLPQSFLDSMATGFNEARKAGVKVIPLCSYNFGYNNDTDKKGIDATVQRVVGHIAQIAPVINAHHDIIACWDAGFIGAWGEWHSSLNNIDDRDSMRVILFAELDALVPQRMITVRVNRYKREIFNTDSALTSAEAFDGSRRSRVGHKNDCLGASERDWGTYISNSIQWEKDYLRNENRFLPQQGETCNPSAWSVCDTMLRDLEHMRWDMLNMDYHQDVIQSWKDDGCYPEVCRRLGYRFVLHSAQFDDAAAKGSTLNGTLRLSNVGFGKVFNPRGFDIILRKQGASQEIRIPANTDVRRWLPDDDTIAVSIAAKIPADAALGTYDILLHLGDTATNPASGQRELLTRPEYSIRLASDRVWEEATGYSYLGLTVEISATSQTAHHGAYQIFGTLLRNDDLYDVRGRHRSLSHAPKPGCGIYIAAGNSALKCRIVLMHND